MSARNIRSQALALSDIWSRHHATTCVSTRPVSAVHLRQRTWPDSAVQQRLMNNESRNILVRMPTRLSTDDFHDESTS